METLQDFWKTKIVLFFGLILFFTEIGFGQTVTLHADYAMTNVSAVTNCGGGIYKFAFKQSSNQVCRFFVKINGTSTNDLGYSGVGCAQSCWWPCRWQSTTSSGNTAVQYYLEVNTNTRKITMTQTNFTCSSCTTPTVGTVTNASRCGTGTAQIRADVSAGSVRWWSASSGGSLLGTSGDNAWWTTPNLSTTTTYYAEAINGSCVSSSRKAVTVTVTPSPTLGTVNKSSVNFCAANGNFGAAVTVSGQTGTVLWDWGSNNGTWNNNWVTNNNSGTCCFPKKISTSDTRADRIRYRVTNGSCPTVTSSTILIKNCYNEPPSSLTASSTNICSGTQITLTATFPNAVNMNGKVEFATTLNGAAFTSITPSANQTVFTANVTPSANTTYYVRYSGITSGGGSCYSTSQSVAITVTAAPSAGTLSGTQGICVGGSTTFSSTVSGGTWSSSNTGIATINSSTGVITGVAAGIATMTYTKTGSGGCSNATATRTVTVTAPPSAGTLSGTQAICVGGSSTFSSTVSGGTWSSSNTSIATINSSTGVISGVAAGTATMTYTKAGTGGCSNATATRTVTVAAPPSAGTLSGTQAICVSGSTTFSSTVSGGTWSSSNTGIATINSSTGAISGVSAGTATMTYTKTGSGGCSNATATRTVTVSATPTISSVSNGERCNSGTVDLAVSIEAPVVLDLNANGGINPYTGSAWAIGDKYRLVFCTEGVYDATSTNINTYNTAVQNAGSAAGYGDINWYCIGSTASVDAKDNTGTSGSDVDAAFFLMDGSTIVASNIAEFWGGAWSGAEAIDLNENGVTPSNSQITTGYAPWNAVWTGTNGSGVASSPLGGVNTTGGLASGAATSAQWVARFSDASSKKAHLYAMSEVLTITALPNSINWYSAPTGGSSLATGTSFTTPSLSSTTTYYVDITNGSCTSSPRTAVTATVNTSTAGPGGVTDELLVWLKADDANLGATWQDHSCNGHDYTTVNGPTLINNVWNDNPAIEILSGGFDAPVGAELGTDWTVFFVAAYKQGGSQGRLIDGHTGNYLLGFHGGHRNGIYWNGTAGELSNGIATSSGATDPHIYTYTRNNSDGSLKTRVDGDSLKTFTSTNSGAGIRLDINQGNYRNESSQARIGEFIIFNKALSNLEIQKVETYLATKYGVSASANDGGNGGDYISSNGTTYWDASSAPDYHNDVVVIGKDNGTLALQKQAKSYDDSLKVFVAGLASSNLTNAGTITNDNAFLAIGHNKGKLKATATSNAEKPAEVESRIEREWKITNTNFTNDFSIEIEWDSTGNVNLAHLLLLVDDDGDFSDASYYSSSNGLTFSFGSIIVSGISTSFIGTGSTKYITLGSSDQGTPLPVELLSFGAEPMGEWIYITWETAAEINNAYFILEKSDDAENWTTITQIDGAGNSTDTQHYSFLDREGCSSTCYYRLSQFDFDGTKKTFDIISISGNSVPKNGLELKVYPNPFCDKISISYSVMEDGIYDLVLYNSVGSEMLSAKAIGVTGENTAELNAFNIPSGNYILVLTDEKGNSSRQKISKTCN